MSQNPIGKETVPRSKQEQNVKVRAKLGDECQRIASDILKGEQLLQRLQLVQQRQVAGIGETENILAEEKDLPVQVNDLTSEDVEEDTPLEAIKSVRTETSLIERIKNDGNGDKPKQLQCHNITIPDGGYSDDNPSVSWVRPDYHETITKPSSFRSTCHRLSVTETAMERKVHRDAQGKQNLQRAGGVLNLADDPDVLEIPFNTNILLEPFPSMVCPGQEDDWQLSQQKTPKEMSPKIQRELGMTGWGKISKVKGETHQLKETKLLFEDFQQDNTLGPARIRKPLSSSMKDPVYPSVLERTRSLEMFSVKSSPISRAHSFRIQNPAISEIEKHSENLSKSPTGGSRDRSRLSPYAKQDKNMHVHRSSESISTDASTPAVLRPALALQPDVEKDIKEAEAREDELRRQRSTLYGETRQSTGEGNKTLLASANIPGGKQPSRGKLERVWPPPSKTERLKSEQTQGARVHRAGSQKSGLWQRWESGGLNGQTAGKKNGP
ncbi:uncharacterized protein LOC133541851 isoform X2 [Nerophis ophidion]|uniref:uncharacterized protein LOC133541851 isoform X2 n=1 Tax=Nerophis ophidion TaxID=159077 RepID=UPI002ADF5DAA|nr:uncharacterized protein LOC133541851 isoform X2 [Nerophis ophidion]